MARCRHSLPDIENGSGISLSMYQRGVRLAFNPLADEGLKRERRACIFSFTIIWFRARTNGKWL
jgi:hypothetical protein